MEGAQYRVGTIKFTGLNLFPEAEVRRQLRFKTGDVFSRSELRDTVRRISDLYSTIGHASADVVPRTDQQPATLTMDVTIEVTEGPEVYVERINISGNTRSEDRILRREIPFVEGDLFTLQKLQRARQRLINLGYFESVNVETQPGTDKTRIIVNVEVTERPTGVFSIGGGYSSVDSFVGTLDISQNNFLGRAGRWPCGSGPAPEPAGDHQLHRALAVRPAARGRLRSVQHQAAVRRLRLRVAGRRRPAEPSLPGVLAGVGDLPAQPGHRRQHPHRERLDSRVAGRHAPDLGHHRSGSPATAVTTSRRRPRVALITMTVDFAGLGGDSQFVKTVASASYFYPIWLNHVLAGRAEVGAAWGWGRIRCPSTSGSTWVARTRSAA